MANRPVMQASGPSLTSEWHNAPYPAIDPTKPANSHAGETVIVTGGGSGIGQATAIAFAEAGATRLVLIGRRIEALKETAEKVEQVSGGKCEVAMRPASVTKAADLKAVAEQEKSIGPWDVLVMSAGRSTNPTTIEEADPDKWWEVFETNARGCFATLHAFLPTRKQGAKILLVSAGVVQASIPRGPVWGTSPYSASKLAQLRIMDFAAVECPDVFVVSVHPGVVETELMHEFLGDDTLNDRGRAAIPLDDVRLPANFNVWATTKDAQFLRGKFVWANWDVDQLKEQAKTISETHILKANIIGYPFQPPK